MTEILSIKTETVCAVVTVVILVLAIGTSAEDLFTNVANVIFVLVRTFAESDFAYVANVVGIYICIALG
jgi:hypothetical protein